MRILVTSLMLSVVHVELRVISRGDELYLNPGGAAQDDEDLDVQRHSEEEGRCLLLIRSRVFSFG